MNFFVNIPNFPLVFFPISYLFPNYYKNWAINIFFNFFSRKNTPQINIGKEQMLNKNNQYACQNFLWIFALWPAICK